MNSRMASAGSRILLTVFVIAGVVSGVTAVQQSPGAAMWRTAWATSQQNLGTTGMTNTTLRLIARVTVAGDAVSVRLDNAYGTSPLRIGRASVGLRTRPSRQVRTARSCSTAWRV